MFVGLLPGSTWVKDRTLHAFSECSVILSGSPSFDLAPHDLGSSPQYRPLGSFSLGP